MSTGNAFLVLSAFLASAVEMVEALTIVLAAGLARGWRSSLAGLGAATLALAVIVAALGPALTAIPRNTVRIASARPQSCAGMMSSRAASSGGFCAESAFAASAR